MDLVKTSVNHNDLLVVDNDLILTSDAQEGGTNNILQDVLQNIRFFLGEWYLDNTLGVPWFQQILVKNPDQANIDTILLNTILNVPGVIGVSQYSFEPNLAKRILTVDFICQTTSGPVQYSGTLTTGGG